MKFAQLILIIFCCIPMKNIYFEIVQTEILGKTPAYEEGSKPQGIVMLTDTTFLVSVHHNDTKSTIYEVTKETQNIVNQFDMPSEATHTSGLTIIDSLLLAVDYNSNTLYVIDLFESLSTNLPSVKAKYKTGLKGTSAITSFEWDNNRYLAISDFMNTRTTYLFDYDLLNESQSLPMSKVGQYNNGWFSQGIAFSNGYLFESRNSMLGNGYIEYRNVSDILNGNQVVVKKMRTTLKGIEDIDFDGKHWWTTDELTFNYYRIKIKND